METRNQVTNIETMDSNPNENIQDWKNLFRVGGTAALIMALFIPIQVIVFVIWPPPSTVIGWFTLFQDNWLVGLLDLDLLLIIDQVLMGLILLALYVVLKRTSPSFTTIALVLVLVGIATYFASTAAFEMLSLSNQYTAATTEMERSMYSTAGQVMIAVWQGTAFNVSYILEGIALLTFALVMLRCTLFNKAIAYIGILLGVLSLVPPTAGTIGLFFAFGSLIPLEIWDILVARRLFQFSKI